MRRLAIMIIKTFVILVVMLSAVQQFGGIRKNPTLLYLELDAGQLLNSCWHYICPGRTSFSALKSRLQVEANRISNISVHVYRGSITSLCWLDAMLLQSQFCVTKLDSDKDTIDYLKIGPLGDDVPVSLGDFIILFGAPNTSNLCMLRWSIKVNTLVTSTQTTFSEGRIIVESYAPKNLLGWEIDPDQKVAYITFLRSPIPISDRVSWIWRGFVLGPNDPIECNG